MPIYRKDTRYLDVNEDQTYIVECDGGTCTRTMETEVNPRAHSDEDFADLVIRPMHWGMRYRRPAEDGRAEKPARFYCPEHRIKPVLNGGEVVPAFIASRISPSEGEVVPTARVWEEYQLFLNEQEREPGVTPGKHRVFEELRQQTGAKNSTKSIRLDGKQTTMPVFRGIALKVTTPGDHLEWYERYKGSKIGALSRKKALAAQAARATDRREKQALAAKLRYHGLAPKVALACAVEACPEAVQEQRAGDLGWVRAVVGEHEVYACLEHAPTLDRLRTATTPAGPGAPDTQVEETGFKIMESDVILDEDVPLDPDAALEAAIKAFEAEPEDGPRLNPDEYDFD